MPGRTSCPVARKAKSGNVLHIVFNRERVLTNQTSCVGLSFHAFTRRGRRALGECGVRTSWASAAVQQVPWRRLRAAAGAASVAD
jgi:hypothetical protein